MKQAGTIRTSKGLRSRKFSAQECHNFLLSRGLAAQLGVHIVPVKLNEIASNACKILSSDSPWAKVSNAQSREEGCLWKCQAGTAPQHRATSPLNLDHQRRMHIVQWFSDSQHFQIFGAGHRTCGSRMAKVLTPWPCRVHFSGGVWTWSWLDVSAGKPMRGPFREANLSNKWRLA